MEYKLELLQKRVNHLEDLILAINDKIGSVLDEFFNHRAKKAADEESICLSLLTKFKSSFEIPERRNRDRDQESSSRSTAIIRSKESAAPVPRAPTPPPVQESQPAAIPQPSPAKSINQHVKIKISASPAPARAARASPVERPVTRGRGRPQKSRQPSDTDESTQSTTASTSSSSTSTSTSTSTSIVSASPTASTLVQTVSTVELITIDDDDDNDQEPEDDDNDKPPTLTREVEEPAPAPADGDSKPDVSALQQIVEQQQLGAILVAEVCGNYSDPDASSSANDNDNDNENQFNGQDQDDDLLGDGSDVETIYSVDENDESALALLCEPEMFIKTENAETGASTSFNACNTTTTTTGTKGNVNQRRNDQEQEHVDNKDQSSVPMAIDPETLGEPVDPDSHEAPQRYSRKAMRNPGVLAHLKNIQMSYRQIRTFKTLEDGKMYLKINGMISRGIRETVAGRKSYFICKGKDCKKLMYLLETGIHGRTILYEKHTEEHNHPPIRVEIRPPRSKRSGNNSKSNSGPPPIQFKLVQTFQSRADAIASIQEQNPGAWILNQVVECPDDVKAYYNCGLHPGRCCPVSMILRTFNENGKVDQHIWQGDHVHGEAAEGKTYADYFAPPATVCSKATNRGYSCTRTFANAEEAQDEIRADENNTWELRNWVHNLEGKKAYYKCRHRKCPVTMYLRSIVLAGKVFQYINDGEHQHNHGMEPKLRIHRQHRRKVVRNSARRNTRPTNPEDWAQVASFASEDEAKCHVRNEMTWVTRRVSSKNAFKVMDYSCKHDRHCPVRCVIRVAEEGAGAATVHILKTEAHVHTTPSTAKRTRRPQLPKELKTEFDALYAQGLCSGEKILNEMQRRGTPVPAYHVLEYVARMRRLKFGPGYGRGRGRGGRGRLAKLVTGNKAVAGRVLSANPKNERKRKEKAERAAAKKERADSAAASRTMDTRAATAPLRAAQAQASASSSATPAPPPPRPSTSAAAWTIALPVPVEQIKTERDDPLGNGLQTNSPFRQMFKRQACIKLKRIEIIDL